MVVLYLNWYIGIIKVQMLRLHALNAHMQTG